MRCMHATAAQKLCMQAFNSDVHMLERAFYPVLGTMTACFAANLQRSDQRQLPR
jgi:hypothetical protein